MREKRREKQRKVEKATRATVPLGRRTFSRKRPGESLGRGIAKRPQNFPAGRRVRFRTKKHLSQKSGEKFFGRTAAPKKFLDLFSWWDGIEAGRLVVKSSKFREGNFGWKICCWRKRRGSIFWGNQKKSLTVSDPPLALPVNPLKVSDWFLGGFHTPVAPQGSPERSPHPADAHVCRTCNAFLTLPHNSKLTTRGSGAASSSSIRSRYEGKVARMPPPSRSIHIPCADAIQLFLGGPPPSPKTTATRTLQKKGGARFGISRPARPEQSTC
ncbi:uncharacterized protein TNCT_431011 [Trichonephila clavata]|uniref:Uncharacterized protein n=1 Tax=Trichonephila clavata TaxID=2740835 RepID=A0A8X6FHD2_TRICU|nr:uncharacterized protein TNCT_431011 [Trichonephila clavata]